MFLKVFLYVCFVGYINAFEMGDFEKYGLFQSILNSRAVTCDHNRNLNLNVSEIKVHFFDFKTNFNTSFSISDAAKGILSIKNLNKRRKFIMFVGGFKSHINHSVENQMREAYKTYRNSYLIIPDHSYYTNNKDRRGVKNYKRSVLHVHYIGKALGQMWAKLNFGGISSKNIHCVGHSLGGQILGHVGSTFFDLTGQKISRVTALDPAGPCFAMSELEDQVRSGVADYVEVYHCNARALGSASILGDVDFFMNKNGEMNPECKVPLLPELFRSSKFASCNHRVCVDVWTTSLKHPNLFWATNCDSYKRFKKGKCVNRLKNLAGAGNNGIAYGNYYFSTKKHNLKVLA